MENRKKHQKQAASFSPGQKTSYGKPYNEYGIFFVLNSKKYSEQFSLKELKASSWKQQSDARSPTVYKSLHSSVYRKFTNVVQLQDSDGVQSRQLWLDLLLLSQRSGFKTQPCVMQLYLPLTSAYVYRPWAATHESGVAGSTAVTPATRTTPVHISEAFLPLQHTDTQTDKRTHTQLGPVLLPQDRSHGTVLWRSAQHDHIGTSERGDSALCMSNDWQHVGLLRGISHGKFVTCSCSPFGWCE